MGVSNRPIKILHLISRLEIGGAEMMLFKLLSKMDRGRFSSSVVSMSSEGTVGERIRAIGVPVYSLGFPRARFCAAGLFRLGRILFVDQPDVVQTWMFHANALTLAVKALWPRAAISWNVRGDFRKDAFSRSARLAHKVCGASSRFIPDVIVFNSTRARDSYKREGYAPSSAFRVIPNGFDLAVFRPRQDGEAGLREALGIGPRSEVIGMVSRFAPEEKDHRTFLEAAARVRKVRSNVRFILCGRGMSADNSTLVREIERRALADAVHLLGERRDVPEVTRAFDIATLVSLVEGFPNVVGEAMACGKPVVATDVGDCRAIVGDAGVIVPPRDAEALARAWLRLLEAGVEERERLGQRAREHVGRLYDIDRVVRRYEALYEALARGRHPGGAGAAPDDIACAESAAP
jgi:glycosyltransferase involved in cell wall biosynthesis